MAGTSRYSLNRGRRPRRCRFNTDNYQPGDRKPHLTSKTPFEAAAGIVNACQALPTVITGGQPTANHLRALKDAGADILLDLRDPMESRPFDEPALAHEVGLEYINVPVSSATLNDATLERVLAVYRNAGEKKIFVHCAGGNRVGATLLPHFMIDLGMEEEDAIEQAMRVGLRSPEMLEWGLDYARRNPSGTRP
jgi:protein tyrosine phosphatase (PTP) superfamily phosphohydrolase (DUF442 family)